MVLRHLEVYANPSNILSKLAHLVQMASRYDICKADKNLRFL